MNTPIIDYVNSYINGNYTRLHMPGHKGAAFLGFEDRDITEIKGADSLYFPKGIIEESEKNATALFDTAATFFSTEGSSQCVKAMLYLAAQNAKRLNGNGRPLFLAARNVHTSFVHGMALIDGDVEWLWGENKTSICSCLVTPKEVEDRLGSLKDEGKTVAAVYITSPDYLGGMTDIEAIAKVAHKYNTLLIVDNAHGAYLKFAKDVKHPMEQGADMCADSAHKTLPVLTGGAYLHISKTCPKEIAGEGKMALSMFGSTSPSYLIMQSLDYCNEYLSNDFTNKLTRTCTRIEEVKAKLALEGFNILPSDPLRITVKTPIDGRDFAQSLREEKIECEFADKDYLVLMLTPQNTEGDFERLTAAFTKLSSLTGCVKARNKELFEEPVKITNVMSIREAMFAISKTIPVNEALGLVCATPLVACPPAIPIAVSGEVIDEGMIRLFNEYEIESVRCVSKPDRS